MINRGNNQQDVFRKPEDFNAFLAALGNLKERKPFELYGYCLLNNHLHLLIRPLETTISRLMQSLLVSHTQRYHKHYQSGGHVWQGRFKSPVIQNDEHLLTVFRYIEANSLQAKIVDQAENYPHSSYRAYGLGEPNELLDRLITYEEFSPYAKVRQRRWAGQVHLPLDTEMLDSIRRSTSSGQPFGSKTWVKRLAKKLDLDLTVRHAADREKHRGKMFNSSDPFFARPFFSPRPIFRTLKYDAWNRLVEVKDGTVVQSNEYDGLNRRIIRDETGGSRVLTHFYYSQQWQVLEERVGTSTSANKQFVYHPHYVDAIAMRRDASGNEHYYLQDANFNVTAVTNDTGAVVERYAYTPYGEVAILDLNFAAVPNNVSAISNEHLYTGRRRDPETGLQLNRNRFYASHLGRWVNRDPIERMLIEAGLTRVKRSGLMIMVGGVVSTAERVNLYAAHFVPNGLDPSGLRRIKWPWTPPGGPVDREECNWVNWMTGSCCTTNQTNAFRHACAKAGLCLGTSYCSATKRFNAFSCEECDKTDQCSFADCDSGKSCGESGTRSCQWDGNRCGCFAGGGIDDPCD